MLRHCRPGAVITERVFSHSWHDDPELKWDALQAWRADFKSLHRREPTVWIDKYCIDQQAIDKSLACPPVYLAGCNKLVIFCGKTYLQRLWCVVVLMVFIEMGGSLDNVDLMMLSSHGSSSDRCSRSSRQEEIATFDPTLARCFTDYDTERLQAVLEASSAGMAGLQCFVQDTLLSIACQP